MICPHDETQMVQKDSLGGGTSSQSRYITWEVKVCPVCDREVVQFYAAIPVSTQSAAEFGRTLKKKVEELIESLYPEY